MMRFVVISDLHLQIPSYYDIKTVYKLHHLENNTETENLLKSLSDSIVAKQRLCLEELCENIIRLEPGLLFITGDIFDSTYVARIHDYENLNYDLRGLFKQFLQTITENCIQVFIIPGNHDIANEEFWSYFSNEFDEFSVKIISSNKNSFLSYPFEDNGVHFMFYLLPYIRNGGSTRDDNKEMFEDYLKFNFTFLWDSSSINILFAHQFINTYDIFYKSTFFDDREDTINVDLLKKFRLVFLGHYHNVSKFFPYDGRIYVPGQAMVHDNTFNTNLAGGCLVDTFLDTSNKVVFTIRYINFHL